MIKSTKIFKLHRLLFVEYTSNRSKKKTRHIYAPLAYQIPSITQILASRSSALFATCQNYTPPRRAIFRALNCLFTSFIIQHTRPRSNASYPYSPGAPLRPQAHDSPTTTPVRPDRHRWRQAPIERELRDVAAVALRSRAYVRKLAPRRIHARQLD
jgi:hypothetical protein